ncbi:MAG: acylneuraminate cytidylyltransferase family protein [Tepidisphaeraceae bacterium]|jgi:CMP-N-acetylneuraminic acid synthetase
MNSLGVILARAGSRGLTDKHLRPLCSKPVIEYTFDHARQSRLLSAIVVSTDCPKIRQLARSRGFQIIDRPAALATSDASVQDAMLHAMDVAERQGNPRADALVVLYGNVPIRPEGIIDRALELLAKSNCDSVRSFCPVGKWHPAWMCRLEGDRAEALVPGSIHRRQDLTPLFLHDGAVVAVCRDSMLRGKENPRDPHAFFGVDRRGILTEPGQTVEIDQLRDLFLAEAVLRERQSSTIVQARVA